MKNQNKRSGVSIAIKKSLILNHHLPDDKLHSKKEFTVKIANSREERTSAFQLAYRVYLDKGFIKESSKQWLIRDYDFIDETITIIVQDYKKRIAGSVTLVFDGSFTLPAENLYHMELKHFKLQGKKTAELSRLVIDPGYRNSKEILNLLFNYAAICIHRVKKYDGLAIQVNPHHKIFYTSLLGFEEIGGEKLCPQVQNAPSVLLYLSTNRYQTILSRVANLNSNEKSMYQKFLKPDQEALVACYLEKQIQPMTFDDKLFFGLTKIDASKTICV